MKEFCESTCIAPVALTETLPRGLQALRHWKNHLMNNLLSPRIVNSKQFALLIAAIVLASAAFSWGDENPYTTPPTPRPVAPPPGIMNSTSPMASLSATQNYSASRVSSYQPQGGPRDNVYVPTDGTEMTLAEIDGPGAITHIWTTHRGTGRDLIVRAYWDGSEHPSIEAESLEVLAHQSTAPKHPEPFVQWEMPNLSGDHMLSFDAGDGGKMSVAVPVDQAGVYSVGVYYARAKDFGKVQLSVNGQSVGRPVDTFLSRNDLVRPIWPPRRFDFPGVRLKQGENVFEFAVESKNPESEGYRMAVDCVVLKKDGE